ncbi:cytochrome C [Niveibacterium sp.]|uniref:cytochrome C n=1 Tax=Niveibacterium sp. TaxID=2017444 RepID=UPI0035AFDBA1
MQVFTSLARALGRHGRLLRCLAAASFAAAVAQPALALPSFARQTGMECAACHVGAYGPQLTPAGIRFKLSGYTDSDGQGSKIPLSAMLVGGFDRTAKDLTDPPTDHTKTNNNTVAQEVSVFLAGRLADKLGAFVQTTYAGAERKTSIDNAELRAADTFSVGGKDLIAGLSLNNNPTVSDPFNTAPAWRFPYMATELAPAPASPLIAGGLGQHVLGVSAYGMYDNHYYAELGTYKALSASTLDKLGLQDEVGRLTSNAYWRLAYFGDLKKQAYHVGLFGLNAGVQPDRTQGPANRYNDIGIDASYQFLGTREHIGTVYASYIHEKQKRDVAYANGEAENQSGTLKEMQLNASYYYNQTWGLTASTFRTKGSSDALLYAPAPDMGSATGSPNTTGYMLQADWTPWGKESSWGSPWANLRLGAQYTWYTRFNGESNNYDGSGRNARDNNTLYLFAWTSF